MHLQHKTAAVRCPRASPAAPKLKVVTARAASSSSPAPAGQGQLVAGDYEALRGCKVVSAADGFEVDLLSLWQVSWQGWLEDENSEQCSWIGWECSRS